jgi:hypothetical protein
MQSFYNKKVRRGKGGAKGGIPLFGKEGSGEIF